MRGMWVCVVALFAVFPAIASAWNKLPPGMEGYRNAGLDAIRGVTVGPIESSQWPGRGYGTEASEELLDELGRLGVTCSAYTLWAHWASPTSIQMTRGALPPTTPALCMMSKPTRAASGVLFRTCGSIRAAGDEIDPGSASGWVGTIFHGHCLAWASGLAGAPTPSRSAWSASPGARARRYWRC